MSVFRISKNNNYTVMSNIHLRDKNMSLKSKGLLSLMLSLPDNWDYSLAGLCAICKENETAIKSALKELQNLKYLSIQKLTPGETESGRFEYVYNIFEFPQEQINEKQEVEKQGVENLPLENLPVDLLPVEYQGQINTNILSTKKLSTERVINNNKGTAQTPSSSESKAKTKRFVEPTVEEIEAYCRERKNNIDAQQFFDHYESVGWHVGKTKMHDWKAAIRTWERRDNGYSPQRQNAPKKSNDGEKSQGNYFAQRAKELREEEMRQQEIINAKAWEA